MANEGRGLPPLETTCEPCAENEGPWSHCPYCHGTGTCLTPEGEMLIEFVRQYLLRDTSGR